MKQVEIPTALARRMALQAQALDGQTDYPDGKDGIAQTIDKLGYVQIDTISAVQRAHHHTLWNRRHDYNEGHLHDLQANDRKVFEYWSHALSYLPMDDFRYYLPLKKTFASLRSKWEKQRFEICGHLLEPVLERITKEGPLGSKDFKNAGDKRYFWGGHPAKMALEMLFWRGQLMVSERVNFQRLFDLPERILPETVNTSIPEDEELGEFIVKRALSAYGIATERDIKERFFRADKKAISQTIENLVAAGDVAQVTIVEDSKAIYFALKADLKAAANLRRAPSHVYLLSPFDNLIIQRDRTKRLFDFEYTLECYVPAPKRKYGYFVLPILWGDQLVGRLDPKRDTKKKRLHIHNLVFEADFNDFDEFLPSFAKALVDYAHFNECEKVMFERISPTGYKRKLQSLVKEYSNI